MAGEINLNEAAGEVAKGEGGAVQTNIAQIKEVMRHYNLYLKKQAQWAVLKMLDEYK